MRDWAAAHVANLRLGAPVNFRPLGSSMMPIVRSNQLVTVEPTRGGEIRVGDVVLVTVGGRTYLHLVKEIRDSKFLIGNNRGGTNGWVHREAIHGRMRR